MKPLSILIILFLLGCQSNISTSSLNYEDEVDRISLVATHFSKALMEGNAQAVMNCYTTDAIIFPSGRHQIDDTESIRAYWTPRPDREIIYHMIIPEHIEMHDSTAIDYGIYEGQSVVQGDTLDPFQGKYVVVWKLDKQNNWKMKYDIWNNSPSDVVRD